MAINNIKIKAHDIHIEKDNNKGGNLTVSENTTTKTLTVNTINVNDSDDHTLALSVMHRTDADKNTFPYLNISGEVSINGPITVNGPITSSNNSNIQMNAIDVTGNMTIGTANSPTSILNVYGSANIIGSNGNLTVSKNINANGVNIGTDGLTVGTSDNQSNVNIHGSIHLYGNAARNISCNNGLNITAQGLAVNSAGNLSLITGSLNNIGISSPTISVTTSTLKIDGTTNTNTLNVSGTTTTQSLTVTGNVGANGATIGTSGLTVNGTTTTNALTVNTNIAANGASIGTGGLTVGTNTNSANVNVFGNISINDNIVLRQNDSKTEIIVGSNDKPLKLFGSGDRPSYSKNGEGNINIALANDICNPTITIKQAGAEKGSFTLNQSDGKTIELTDTTYTPGTGLGLSTDNKFYVKTDYATKGTNYQVTTDDSGNLYVAVPWTNAATTSSNGLMSSTDKSKLDGIETGATNITVDSSLSSTSTNPVQNNVIKSALDRKANLGHDHDGRYLKIEDTGAVILSSGPLKINYDDPGDYAPSDNAKYRPFPGINSSDLDMFIFDTGISCFDNESGEDYQYSFPAKTGIFAMTSDLNSYLSKSGGSITGMVDFRSIVDFSDNAAQIAFNNNGHYVTNMICGSFSTNVKINAGDITYANITLPGGAKGEGSWIITVTAEGTYSSFVAVGTSDITDNTNRTGFSISIYTIKNIPSGAGPMNFHYVAVKYQ